MDGGRQVGVEMLEAGGREAKPESEKPSNDVHDLIDVARNVAWTLLSDPPPMRHTIGQHKPVERICPRRWRRDGRSRSRQRQCGDLRNQNLSGRSREPRTGGRRR